MSELLRNELAEPRASSDPPDLLACLYQNIGISAVAAALAVVAESVGPKAVEESDQRRNPALLEELAQIPSFCE